MKRRTKEPESIALEKKPPGWIIRVENTDDGLLLQWPLSGTAVQNVNLFVARFVLPIWLCGWIAAGITVYFSAIASDPTPKHVGIWLVIWQLPIVWSIFTGAALYKRSRPEAIWLANDCFGYDPGAMCPTVYGRDYSLVKHWRYIFSSPVRTVIAKTDLSKFELVRTQEVQRLSFQHDLETVEIGHCLCESERKWLFTVLEHWRMGRDSEGLDILLAEKPLIDESQRSAIVANREDLASNRRSDSIDY